MTTSSVARSDSIFSFDGGPPLKCGGFFLTFALNEFDCSWESFMGVCFLLMVAIYAKRGAVLPPIFFIRRDA